MERGGGGRRGGRRGGGSRWRGGDRTHSQDTDGDAPRGGGGRRAGGGHRSRGWRGGAPRGGRGGPPPPDRGRVEQDDPDTKEEGEEEESGGFGFSRRKVVSNWDRYEKAEKEAQSESVEVQRGADYSVLLSSAGDSFAQFRFADEKEWDAEQSGSKQISALNLDCQSLVLALQELPLYLRLNLDAALVQEETPLEIPQTKSKGKEDSKVAGPKFGIPKQAVAKVPFSDTIIDDVAHKVPFTSDGNPVDSSQAVIANQSILQHEAATLDSELDLLLTLEDSVIEEKTMTGKKELINPPGEKTLKMDFGHVEEISITPPGLPQADETEESCIGTSKEQHAATPKVTEEDLEDWLDSMIS